MIAHAISLPSSRLFTSCGTGTYFQEFNSAYWLCYHLLQQNGCGVLKTQVKDNYVSVSVNSLLVLYHVCTVYTVYSSCISLFPLNVLSSAWLMVFSCFRTQNFFIPLLPGMWFLCFILLDFHIYTWRYNKHLVASFFFYQSAKESLGKITSIFIRFATYWGLSI